MGFQTGIILILVILLTYLIYKIRIMSDFLKYYHKQWLLFESEYWWLRNHPSGKNIHETLSWIKNRGNHQRKELCVLDHRISMLELSEALKVPVFIASQHKEGESKSIEFIPFDKKYRVYKNKEEVFCTIYQNEAIENYNEI